MSKPAELSLNVRLALCLLLLTLTGSAALGQSLAGFVPAGSLTTLSAWQDSEPAPNLRAELEALDWQAGLATLLQFAEATGATDEFAFLTDMLLDGDGEAAAGLLDFCPDLEAAWQPDAYLSTGSTVLFSLGFSPFNPEPAFTVIADLNGEQTDLAGELLPALLDCAVGMELAEIVELDQDGVPFWQVSIDFESPFAFALSGNIFTLSSSVDQLRYSLRLQAGSDEPSFEDSSLHDSWAVLNRGIAGWSWTVDYAVIADLIEVFGPSLGSEELAGDLAASFRTAGGTVGGVSFEADGIVYENQLVLNPDGGDRQLYDLLLSTGLSLPDAPNVPAGAISVSSTIINLNGFHDYAQGWLDRLSVMVGEDLNLRLLLAQEGVDLDALLLGWLGTDVHAVQLETSTAGLGSLVRGPAQILSVAVTDPGAAMNGVHEILDVISLINELEGDDSFDLGVDTRAASWNGVSYERIRVGPLTDLGVTTLDNYLVIGLPHTSLHLAIDEYLDGGRSATVFRPAGDDIMSSVWLDAGAEIASLAALADTLVQPLAFALRTFGLDEAASLAYGDSWDSWETVPQDWSQDLTYGNRDVAAEEHVSLALGTVQTAQLDSMSEAFWLLEGTVAGEMFLLRMESNDLDSVLDLYELETGRQVAYNDDYDWTAGRHAQIDFTPLPGITYVAMATSWDSSAGEYTISLQPAVAAQAESVEEEVPAVEVPGFSELIDMLSLVPQAIGITADRTFELTGFQERRGDTLYARYILQTDW